MFTAIDSIWKQQGLSLQQAKAKQGEQYHNTTDSVICRMMYETASR
jgi:hypothetical protein